MPARTVCTSRQTSWLRYADIRVASLRDCLGWEVPTGSAPGEKCVRRVAAVAEEVVALHRKRLAVAGHAYPPDTPWQREMESAFTFEGNARSADRHCRRPGRYGGRRAHGPARFRRRRLRQD